MITGARLPFHKPPGGFSVWPSTRRRWLYDVGSLQPMDICRQSRVLTARTYPQDPEGTQRCRQPTRAPSRDVGGSEIQQRAGHVLAFIIAGAPHIKGVCANVCELCDDAWYKVAAPVHKGLVLDNAHELRVVFAHLPRHVDPPVPGCECALVCLIALLRQPFIGCHATLHVNFLATLAQTVAHALKRRFVVYFIHFTGKGVLRENPPEQKGRFRLQ